MMPIRASLFGRARIELGRVSRKVEPARVARPRLEPDGLESDAASERESDVRITGIDCHVLLQPDLDVGATSSAQDDIVVEIHTDEGISGIG